MDAAIEVSGRRLYIRGVGALKKPLRFVALCKNIGPECARRKQQKHHVDSCARTHYQQHVTLSRAGLPTCPERLL